MLTCSNCGATVREGAKFCTACGTRLNDAVGVDSANAWATPGDAGAGAGAADRTDRDLTGAVAATSPSTTDRDAGASTASADPPPSPDGEFSWAWGDPVDGDSGDDHVTEVPAVKLDEGDKAATESDGDDDPIVDASELDILEEDHTTSDEDDAVAAGSDHQSQSATDDDDTDDSDDNETLAAWAEQWDESADESASTSTDARDSSATTDVDDEDSSDDKGGTVDASGAEDSVAKAERLLGELRAMMPALINPRPAAPASPDASTVADDLESAAKIGHFDDVSEALLAARDNPRDVDNMLSLAGMVDRLLELLDDRNNLAKTAESAASRIRSTNTSSLM